jgi:hypothetical protein
VSSAIIQFLSHLRHCLIHLFQANTALVIVYPPHNF